MRMMEDCWNRMISFGGAGMLLGITVVVVIVVFAIWAIGRVWSAK